MQPSAPATTHWSTSHKLFSQTSAWKIIHFFFFFFFMTTLFNHVTVDLYRHFMYISRTFSRDLALFSQSAFNTERNQLNWLRWRRISRYWISALKWPNLKVLQMFGYYDSDGLQTLDRSVFISWDRNNKAVALTWVESWPKAASKVKVFEETVVPAVCLWGVRVGTFSNVICFLCRSSLKE